MGDWFATVATADDDSAVAGLLMKVFVRCEKRQGRLHEIRNWTPTRKVRSWTLQ